MSNDDAWREVDDYFCRALQTVGSKGWDGFSLAIVGA